jgi:hypothetical protein
MNKSQLIQYWQKFFADLLVGTFKNLFLFILLGIGAGFLATYSLNSFFITPTEWSGWLQWLVLLVALGWLEFMGVLHGLIACVLKILDKKLREMVTGLHDLLDLLVGGVLASYPKINKNIPRKELEQKFDQLGQKFLEELKLRGGPIAWIKSVTFRIILKVLKFLFLNDIMDELNKKNKEELTRADIESAVRRVGVEFLLSSIHDNVFLLHCANGILLLLTFGLPFFLFWIF